MRLRSTLGAWGPAVLLAWACSAHAAPQVPDPQAWAQLTPQQQAQRREALQRELDAATPAERQAFRARLRQRLETLSPAERKALVGQTRERWQALSPEERQGLYTGLRKLHGICTGSGKE